MIEKLIAGIRASKGVPVVLSVAVLQKMTEDQYLDVHKALRTPPGRFKGWSDMFVFAIYDLPTLRRVGRYLRKAKIRFTANTEVLFE